MVAKSKPLKTAKTQAFNFLASRKPSEIEALVKRGIPRLLEEGLIPKVMPENPNLPDEPKKLILDFKYYHEDICRLQATSQSTIAAVLQKLQQIQGYTAKQFDNCPLVHGTIQRATARGDYQELFKYLDPDVDKIYEIEISGYGRMYGHIAGDIFYFVGLDSKHRNTH